MNFKLTNSQLTFFLSTKHTSSVIGQGMHVYVAMFTAAKPVYSVYCIYRRAIQQSVKFQFGPYTL